ncbi:hypothetical protein [Metasolibacillus meyeri]|uniref:hypothetical protein n=1 Tax=Metasolibacillus meyeri TaxID=1071052 RepID=UPI00187D45E7|nr:hypothetical protein [Metasolibacillus meyeri]
MITIKKFDLVEKKAARDGVITVKAKDGTITAYASDGMYVKAIGLLEVAKVDILNDMYE